MLKKTLSEAVTATSISAMRITCEGSVSNEGKTYRNVRYFYQKNGDVEKIDVSNITHLNYSFALIHHNEEKNEQEVPDGPLYTLYLSDPVKADLARIPELKKRNPNLKVLLSVGGWGCRGFSDSAASEEARNTFADSCKEVIDIYSLDGIDLDWEYPVEGGWGMIKAVPEDKQKFTLLLQAVRAKIGKNELLTIAAPASYKYTTDWTEITKITDIVDFINIMAYDLAHGTQYYNAPLYPSQKFSTTYAGDNYSIDSTVTCYLKAGITGDKLNLGIPFYGRAPQRAFEPGMDGDTNKAVTQPYFKEGELPKGSEDEYAYKYWEIVNKFLNKNGFVEKWDSHAKVPYLLFKDKFAFSYEDEQSIGYKTAYLKEKGLGGAMFWDYSGDYNNVLANKIAVDLGIKKDTVKLP
jgi:chitinase